MMKFENISFEESLKRLRQEIINFEGQPHESTVTLLRMSFSIMRSLVVKGSAAERGLDGVETLIDAKFPWIRQKQESAMDAVTRLRDICLRFLEVKGTKKPWLGGENVIGEMTEFHMGPLHLLFAVEDHQNEERPDTSIEPESTWVDAPERELDWNEPPSAHGMPARTFDTSEKITDLCVRR